MRDRRLVLAVAATVSFGLALALAVLAVAFVVAVEGEYGHGGWHWWIDPTVYLLLAVPLLPALVGAWLLRRARRR
jgi:hypothetical protein